MSEQCQGESPSIRPCANADQEVWVQNQIMLAVRTALDISKQCTVRADEYVMTYGIRGIVEGAAREIIQTLGMGLEYKNIRRIDE